MKTLQVSRKERHLHLMYWYLLLTGASYPFFRDQPVKRLPPAHSGPEHRGDARPSRAEPPRRMLNCYKCSKSIIPVAGTVFTFFIFMRYQFIETIQVSSEIGVVFRICLQFLYRHGDSRGSSFVSARYLSWPELGVFPESERLQPSSMSSTRI